METDKWDLELLGWILRVAGILFWVLAMVAMCDHVGGNPTAINGVIGAAFLALFLTIVGRYLVKKAE